MGTSKRALATITGRQREEDQNALELVVLAKFSITTN